MNITAVSKHILRSRHDLVISKVEADLLRNKSQDYIKLCHKIIESHEQVRGHLSYLMRLYNNITYRSYRVNVAEKLNLLESGIKLSDKKKREHMKLARLNDRQLRSLMHDFKFIDERLECHFKKLDSLVQKRSKMKMKMNRKNDDLVRSIIGISNAASILVSA